MRNPRDLIIVALDAMTKPDAFALAEKLRGRVWGFKVNDLLLTYGAGVLTELKQFGRVFADAKLHDIPNTVANSVQALAAAGADFITVHASGGTNMVREAVSKAGKAEVLGVSVLTSLSDDDTQGIFGCSARDGVLRLVKLAAAAGVPGIVCSAQELELVTSLPAARALKKVIPGIRPAWHGKADDQSRTLTPKEALVRGATHLVIGRPITGHADPSHAVDLLLEELS